MDKLLEFLVKYIEYITKDIKTDTLIKIIQIFLILILGIGLGCMAYLGYKDSGSNPVLKDFSVFSFYSIIILFIFFIIGIGGIKKEEADEMERELTNDIDRVLNIINENKGGINREDILKNMLELHGRNKVDGNVFSNLQAKKGSKWISNWRVYPEIKNDIKKFNPKEGEFDGGKNKGYDIGPLIEKGKDGKYRLTEAGEYVIKTNPNF